MLLADTGFFLPNCLYDDIIKIVFPYFRAGVNCFRLKFYAHLGMQSIKNAWLIFRYVHGRALSVRVDPRCSIIQLKDGAYRRWILPNWEAQMTSYDHLFQKASLPRNESLHMYYILGISDIKSFCSKTSAQLNS